MNNSNDFIEPIHPGKILRDNFLKTRSITQKKLAKETGIPKSKISQIINGKRIISTDTALKLAKFFHTSPEYWKSGKA